MDQDAVIVRGLSSPTSTSYLTCRLRSFFPEGENGFRRVFKEGFPSATTLVRPLLGWQLEVCHKLIMNVRTVWSAKEVPSVSYSLTCLQLVAELDNVMGLEAERDRGGTTHLQRCELFCIDDH